MKKIWKMPVPITGLVRGPVFKQLPKRQCEISFSVEGKNGEEKMVTLLFDGVESYKCTFLTSLSSVDPAMRKEAYGSVVSIENSAWLMEVKTSYTEYCSTAKLMRNELQHLAICFDDGPFYEIICCGFKSA